jgi:hypothetical protein
MTDILGQMETHRGHVRVFEHYRELPDPVREDIRVKRDRYQNMRGMLAPDTGPAGALGRDSQDKGSL